MSDENDEKAPVIHTTPDDWSDPRQRGAKARDRAEDRVEGKGVFGHIGAVIAGIVLVIIGIPMLVCPGPGVVTIMTGVGLIVAGLGVNRRHDDAG